MWMKRWSNSTSPGHAAIPDSRRPDIRIGRGRPWACDANYAPAPDKWFEELTERVPVP